MSLSEYEVETSDDKVVKVDTGDPLTSESYLVIPSGKLASVTRKLNEMVSLLEIEPPIDATTILTQYTIFGQRLQVLDECVKVELSKLLTAEDGVKLLAWQGKYEEKVAEFRNKVQHWLNINKTELPTPSVRSKSLKSARSVLSDGSSVLRAKLAEQRAKRETEEKYRMEYEALEKQISELKLKRELFYEDKLQKEIEALNEEKSVCDSEEESVKGKGVTSKDGQLLELFYKSHHRAQLPFAEPPVFDGTDISLFRPFMLSYHTNISDRCDNNKDKLHYLEKYTAGAPKQLVQSCFGTADGYECALKLLQERYDNEFKIADCYLQKIANFPVIKNEDRAAFDNFSIFLTSCLNVMQNIDSLNQLNSPKDLMSIVKKLPYKFREKWRVHAYGLDRRKIKIDFKQFVDFVNEQASIVNFPIFNELSDPKESVIKLNKPRNLFVTSAESACNEAPEAFNQRPESSANLNNSACICCKKFNHDLLTCKFFSKQPHDSKLKLVRDHKLCFGCLKGGHRSAGCTNRAECLKCHRKHPTQLHIDNYNNERQNVKTLSTLDKCQIQPLKMAHAMLPIKIKIPNERNYIHTYMALDNFSSDCFMDENLINKLGLTGNATTIHLTTFEGKRIEHPTFAMHNIEITDLDGNECSVIPTVYSCSKWPFEKSDCPTEKDVANLSYLSNIPFRYIDSEVGLLVGANMPSLLKPLQIVSRGEDEPFAILHKLGWSLNGPVSSDISTSNHCHRVKADYASLDEKVSTFLGQDFADVKGLTELSMDDNKWLHLMEKSCMLKNGHFELCLPFNSAPNFPDNKQQVLSRLYSTKRRLLKDSVQHAEYSNFMKEMLSLGFAEKVPAGSLQVNDGKVWYLTHHGVYHPSKGKLRVVFDCSMKFNNVSLNDKLLQGVDLTNNLLSVLLKFREFKIGILADIRKMFYQVKVPNSDRDYLRYFWFPDGNLNKEPVEYRLKVHVFGARSSPSCANFALKNTVNLNPSKFSLESQGSVQEDFYVDDWVKSVDSVCEGKQLVREVTAMVSQAGFELASFSSNSRELLADLPVSKLSNKLSQIELLNEGLPYERALGVMWNSELDYFEFSINFKEFECTKRGILSTTFSIYDPFGFASPVILPAKRVFQLACAAKIDWDEILPLYLKSKWDLWFQCINNLSNFRIPRCYSKLDKDSISKYEVHIFCDGSETAYAAVAFLRVESPTGVQCSLLLSKSRLTPVSNKTLKTVPRIELAAASLAVKVKLIIEYSLTLKICNYAFWSDSVTVLHYINNDSTRFQRFVANKVAYIRTHSEPQQWRYVPSEVNIADMASRSTTVAKLLNCQQWIRGPDFLVLNQNEWPVCPESKVAAVADLEVRQSNYSSKAEHLKDPIEELFNSCSSLHKLKRRVCWFLKMKTFLRKKSKFSLELTVQDMKDAEFAIFSFVQHKHFNNEISSLEKNVQIPKNSSLKSLNPFVHNGLLRAGGRLRRSQEDFEFKHPVILPKKCFITELLVQGIHKEVGHLGKKTILSHLRKKYWVTGVSNLIDKITRNCLSCRKQHAKTSSQLMADLPVERFKCNEKPFSYIGVDCFGPFIVTRGRKTEKRYGIIFTCLSSRAMHLEVLSSLETDSFLCSFSRFTSRRGPVSTIRSDNGGNFVAGSKVLNNVITDWNKQSHSWMLQRNIEWIFNPPLSSHFGGIWEREIRSVRKGLNALLSEQRIRLTDERLNTLMCEVEGILNSRPLTEISSDISDLEPLTPNHLLLSYATVSFPPGLFSEDDLYVKNRWRQVQYLADLFWSRWRKEYLPLLQKRQKWQGNSDPHKVGDLVLITDQFLPRNQWSTGRIVEVYADKFGKVRSARVRVAKAVTLKNKVKCEVRELDRPVVKLVLLKSLNTSS